MSGYDVVGDWGTSRLRLFRLVAGAVTDRREGPGIAALPAEPADVLRAALAGWQADGAPGSIRLSGMIGSRNGWIDAPYAPCPAGVADWRAAASTVAFDRGHVTILPGLACADDAGVPDVMRGEETQIFGALARDPALRRGRHILVLPGTHSKWTLVEDGRVTRFRTFLTGELFALLRDHSILARAGGEPGDAGDDTAGFADGLARADAPLLLAALFEARAAQLRLGRSPGWALGFLSGLVIGREVGEAVALFAPRAPLRVIGDPALAARYAQAFDRHALACTGLDGDACALAGLTLTEFDP